MPDIPAARMHPDELEIGAGLVRALLASQFPRWAELPLARLGSMGTDNAIFRLGDDLLVRMPLRPSAVASVEKEWAWLPQLAPALPIPTPVPLALGEPAEGYPWRWSVIPRFEGETGTPDRIGDSHEAAQQLAEFVLALQAIDSAGGPPPSIANFLRGVPLAQRDASFRRSLAAVEGVLEVERDLDLDALLRAWEAALAAPEWNAPPRWLHGDLLSGNLLVAGGRLTAVLDFETLAVGDPANDLLPAWAVFNHGPRETFRAALGVDDAMWARGRGWALTTVGALPYYRESSPGFAALARRTLDEVLAETE
jgi:aminoglycoside phosphotransferase (APT) family kinase protein